MPLYRLFFGHNRRICTGNLKMGRALGLCALVLLQITIALSAEVLIFCDDPTVSKAVTSALTKFNQGMMTGNKLALFQVTFASKAENGSYWLKFTTRRSNCSASDDTPWTDCDYLHIDKEPIKCNATVHMNETDTDTEHVECQIEDLSTSGKADCLGCPEDIDENGPATRQVVAGFRFKFKFDMRRTNCAKAEHKELHELCEFDQDNIEFANCNSTVDMAPWRQEVPNVHLECGTGQMPPTFLRRRPTGWSPLRNFFMAQPTESPQTPDMTAAPKVKKGKGSGKEESSEEDLVKPSIAPDDSPFHCPSKTWKPFVPVHDGSSVNKAAPQDPPAVGAFSDVDLLG
ncbi:hypothetical protein WMY93_002630 [Mugilogobius chulae]|uniref:Cystatin domain-containing protein n=1 Tax=Mugilogobius chulae TaxID=88201 RepID=A0AAW0PX86_9GOBI